MPVRSLVEQFLAEVWQILLELSPSLLLGLFIAGLMHVYLPSGLVRRGLSGANLRSVARASLIGVPLPLCSCGVIPTALGLRNDGASKGATTAFMISTPATGVDSVLVSSSFLGWPFAIFKVVSAFVTGIIGGALVNRFTAPDEVPHAEAPAITEVARKEGLAGALRYALFDLLGAIDLWLIAGVLVAALLSTLLPADYFADQTWSQGLLGMLVVLAVSIPLYVCTTGSVPIAASLIAAGMPAGSALVFLMAGPATNVATLGAVYRALGGRILMLYLGTVVVMSVLLGLSFDQVIQTDAVSADVHSHGSDWLAAAAALTLLALLVFLFWRRWMARFAPRLKPSEADLTLKVQGMTCQHCVANVKKTLEDIDCVDEATPELRSGVVRIRGNHLDASGLIHAVEKAGFQAERMP